MMKNKMKQISHDEYSYLCARGFGFKSAQAVPDKKKEKLEKVKVKKKIEVVPEKKEVFDDKKIKKDYKNK